MGELGSRLLGILRVRDKENLVILPLSALLSLVLISKASTELIMGNVVTGEFYALISAVNMVNVVIVSSKTLRQIKDERTRIPRLSKK